MPDRNGPPMDDDDFNLDFDLDDDFDDWSKYEGVEFIRSTESEEETIKDDLDDFDLLNAGKSKPAPRPKVKKQNGHSTVKKKVKSKSQYSLYMGMIAALGAFVCIGAFVLMFSLVRDPSAKPANPTPDGGNSIADIGDIITIPETQSDIEITALITLANAKELTAVDINNEKEYLIYADGTTKIYNAYGNAITLSQVGTGDIVDIAFHSVTGKAQEIKLNASAWVRESVTGVQVDGNSVKVGDSYYKIPSTVVFLPLGSATSFSAISEGDTVTLSGVGDQVRTVTIEKRHGYLRITNYSKIEDGFMEIGRDIYKALEEADRVLVPEGMQMVVISGANIDTISKSVTIKAGETTELSLNDIEVRQGSVVLRVNQSGYRVYVNDVESPSSSEPLSLPYGVYKLRVEKEGFDPWTGDVRVEQPSVTVTVNLNKEVRMGKVTVVSRPEGGSVYIDNAYFGLAPVRTDIEYGEHRLTVKMAGYDDSSTTIMVDGENREYEIILRPEGSGLPADTGTTNSGTNTGNTGTNQQTQDNQSLPGTDSGYTPVPSDLNSDTDTPVIVQ